VKTTITVGSEGPNLNWRGKGRAKKVTEAVVLDNPKSGQDVPIDSIASALESQLSVDKAAVL
jgi:hypothetical protein